MGFVAHDAVVVCFWPGLSSYEGIDTKAKMGEIEEFRGSLPSEFYPLLVGPIHSLHETVTYVFCPDGSKEGWPESNEGDELRRKFVALFDEFYGDGSSPYNVACVRFGNDWQREFGATVTRRPIE